jgi:hypothetical protein
MFVRGYLAHAANSIADILRGVNVRMDHNKAWRLLTRDEQENVRQALNQIGGGSGILYRLAAPAPDVQKVTADLPVADCEIPF